MPQCSAPPDNLSPERRLQTLATILAEGVRRYRKLAQRCEVEPAESGTCLEVLPETRLSVSRFQG